MTDHAREAAERIVGPVRPTDGSTLDLIALENLRLINATTGIIQAAIDAKTLELRQQLAAANARVKELEESK